MDLPVQQAPAPPPRGRELPRRERGSRPWICTDTDTCAVSLAQKCASKMLTQVLKHQRLASWR